MDVLKRGFLCLPLDLRQQIYGIYFEESPTPSILFVNRQVHDESMHFIRRYQETFSYYISESGAGIDNFSRWCFRIKGHTPELSRIKHIILNLHPPYQNYPSRWVRLWENLVTVCKELASQSRILQLTVKFIESGKAGWAANGVPHTTLRLAHYYEKDHFFGNYVGQIVVMICRVVENVENPRVILPSSHRKDMAQCYADYAEKVMTGYLKIMDDFDEYELLETSIKTDLLILDAAIEEKPKLWMRVLMNTGFF